jgi:hypothetical protein
MSFSGLAPPVVRRRKESDGVLVSRAAVGGRNARTGNSTRLVMLLFIFRRLAMHRPAWIVRCLLLASLASGATRPASAVVVSTTRDTDSQPPDDFGWSNVGIARGSTAVYLGDRWVIGAAHVGVGPVTFSQLGTFTVEASTVVQLTNPVGSGLIQPADLIVYRLSEDPGLPSLDIALETPDVGTEVWVAGHGLNAELEPTHWDVTQRGANWIWKEVPAPGDYSGYKTDGSRVMRWGTNLIEDDETFLNELDDDILTKLVTSTTQTLTLLTEFDDDASKSDDGVLTVGGSSATAYESQAVLNDSGGGMFIRVGNRWQLAGTILSVEGHRDQPDVTRNPMFGNLTYYADLPTYADQILSRVRFGDFNSDLALTIEDVDALIRAMNDNSDVDLRFDLDRDGAITSTDLDRWVAEVFGTYSGDSNLDGQFDTSDLILVLQGGGYEDEIVGNGSWASGDWDGDLEFTTNDFVVALQAGGFEAGLRSDSPPPSRHVAAVPEPSAMGLSAMALASLLACWRRA